VAAAMDGEVKQFPLESFVHKSGSSSIGRDVCLLRGVGELFARHGTGITVCAFAIEAASASEYP